MSREVVIDGVRYVPVVDCEPSAKQISTVLVDIYMGGHPEEDTERLSEELKVSVDEYHEHDPTINEVVASIMEKIMPS